jgi:D-alanyl-lipoteichoic acid acyltransferase DltB (MBOAT superfamily)
MIFTSYTYVAFLLLVFLLHWSMPVSWRKPLLIAASYVFYCSWRWEFGFLLLGVSLFNWSYGRFVLPRWPTLPLLLLGVAANLTPLIYYKYTGFFIQNAAAVAHWLGSGWVPPSLSILLPLGISFFSFQGIAYLVDIATGEEPLERLSDFLLFKSFWPQLIAGPIVRLHEMRKQLETPRSIDYEDLAAGCQRILFGFFKKVVLADNLAPSVDMVYLFQGTANAADAAVGILGFGMQIYFDFSAYSDIAIGSARLFGYRFPENFNWPYLAASPQEFWNRWHMTLSSWIRDYVFTPLTFLSRSHPSLGTLWLVVAMALCGLWHGAQWTFVAWGIWHGLLLAANQTILKKVFPRPAEALNWQALPAVILTFALANVAWVFFRAGSLQQSASLLGSLFTLRGGFRPAILRETNVLLVGGIFAGMLAVHALHGAWTGWTQRSALGWRVWLVLRPVAYTLAICCVIVFDQEARSFVYFQF